MRITPGIYWKILSWLLIGAGVIGDVLGGVALLHDRLLPGLILHVGSLVIWGAGILLPDIWKSYWGLTDEMYAGQPAPILDGQKAMAVLLGACLFPGLGSLGYSLAGLLAGLIRTPQTHLFDHDEGADLIDPLLEICAEAAAPSNPELKIRPLVEVLNLGDSDSKRAVLDLICREPGPRSLALARRMLPDSDPDVRALAAVAVSRLEGHLNDLLKEATARLEQEPEVAEHYANIGQIYAQYGQADSANGYFFRAQARQAFERALALDPERDDIRAALIEVLMRLSQESQASDEVARLLKKLPEAASAVSLAMKVAFQQRQFKKVAVLARQALATMPYDDEYLGQVRWWDELNIQYKGEAR